MNNYYPNPLRTHLSKSDKTKDFVIDRNAGAMAYRQDEKPVPLKQCKFEDVEFIGGLWRLQEHAAYNIRKIRDQEFIMGPRIDITEKNYFEYYKIAKIPQFNCYGPIHAPKFDMVAARYITDHGEYWGYGTDVASARAFLGIRLYDEYMDLIHAAACRNQNTQKR